MEHNFEKKKSYIIQCAWFAFYLLKLKFINVLGVEMLVNILVQTHPTASLKTFFLNHRRFADP